MAHIERLTVYPVKGLDGIALGEADVLDGGTLAHDREFALFDGAGDVVNGKRTDRIHGIDADFEPASGVLSVEAPGSDAEQFDLVADPERAAEWFGDYFGMALTLERDASLGYVDRRDAGPSVISTATLETVASWFDGVSVESARRRMRANVEVGGVPAFWEDRFVGDDAPAFVAGGVRFEGVKPCGRCVVPERDPDSGERTADFRERFADRRRETFPEWADEDAFDHFYKLMLISRIPEASRGRTLRTGDPVEVTAGGR